jgi:hypothetical protein
MSKHRPDYEDRDCCVCGAEITYFEPLLDDDSPESTGWGYGCPIVGRPTASFRHVR